MTTKAVRKEASVKTAVLTGIRPQTAARPEYQLIPLRDLQPSKTNPRRRIDDEGIESLALSIRAQGVLEPLIVRPRDKKYEIVCGERRYRAARAVKNDDGRPAPLQAVPCIVRILTDEQVLDIQIHENLHREDVHPMDEAYTYQLLKEKLDCDAKELALRVGKSEGYVLNRLKLNTLIKEAQNDIDDGHLPLAYALEIAKYTTEIQQLVYGEVYRKEGKILNGIYSQVPIKGQTVPMKAFIEWVNLNIHRMLVKAPFDIKATNLRADGLACIKCAERTGAAVSLFEPNQMGRKDACLNPECFKKKMVAHVEVRRRELAQLSEVEPSAIPVVKSFSYSNGNDYLGSESAIVIGDVRGATKKKCRNSISGIDVEPDNYGRTVQVCLKTTNCKVHWPMAKASSNGKAEKANSEESRATANLELKRSRREEIWNAKVAEAVRVRVFKEAAEKFEKKFRLSDVGSNFLPQLVARFWRMTSSGDSNNLNGVVRYLLAEWKTVQTDGLYIGDGMSAVEDLKKLDRGVLFRVLFLLIHSHKGTVGYSNSYSSQREVRELATEFDVDYPLIDAEVRLEFCSKKHKEAHQLYLDGVRSKKKDAKVPFLFSEKWKARD